MLTETDLIEYDVFISYSRADKATALEILHYVEERGKNAWLDQDDIHHGVDFIDEIYEGIEKSENFVFMISPDSVKSEVCKLEMDHALSLNKRIIPILAKPTSTATVHEKIAAINWIIAENDDWAKVCEDLINVLNTDVKHVKLHTILLREALAWNREQKPNSMVLRGRRLVEASEWLEDSEDKEPKVTKLHRKFIRAGQKYRTKTQARLISGVSIALLLSIGLAIYAFYERSVAAERAAIAQSRQIAMTAANLDSKNPELSALLAVKAVDIYETKGAIAELLGQEVLWNKVYRFFDVKEGFRSVFVGNDEFIAVCGYGLEIWHVDSNRKVNDVATSFKQIERFGDNQIVGVVSYGLNNKIQILDVPSLDTAAEFQLFDAPIEMYVSQSSNFIAFRQSESIEIYDAKAGSSSIAKLPGYNWSDYNTVMAFNSADNLVILTSNDLYTYDVTGDSILSKVKLSDVSRYRRVGSLTHNLEHFGRYDTDHNLCIFHVDSPLQQIDNFLLDHSMQTGYQSYSAEKRFMVNSLTGGIVNINFNGRPRIDFGIDGKKTPIDLTLNKAGTQLAVTYSGDGVVLYNLPIAHVDLVKLAEQELGRADLETRELTLRELVDVQNSDEQSPEPGTLKEVTEFYENNSILLSFYGVDERIEILLDDLGNFDHTWVSESDQYLVAVDYDSTHTTANLQVYEMVTQKLKYKYTIPNYQSSGAYTFSKDGTKLAFYTYSPKPMYVVWDMPTNVVDTLLQHEKLDDTDNVSEITFDANNLNMAVVVYDDMCLYNLETKGSVALEKVGKNVGEIEFHPTQNLVYGVYYSGEIVVWDRSTGLQIGSNYKVSPTTFKEWLFDWEDEVLWTLDNHGTVRRTELNHHNQAKSLLQKVGRTFTEEEWTRYFPEEEYEVPEN